ncbi:MAG: ester cyclase [Sphingobacteriales bacterium]|nr:ester cyclase [Sphingobacteriales bacterium]
MDRNKEALTSFYRKALTVNKETRPEAVLAEILADGFISSNTREPAKSKEALIKQVGFFWQLVPDLKWEPQEIISEGNKYVVRSIASGTPNGPFMGVETDGTKSFRIMTIDIHTAENGKIKSVYHVEEWGDAIAQLNS